MSKQSRIHIHQRRFTAAATIFCILCISLAICQPQTPEPGVIEGTPPTPQTQKLIQDESLFGVKPNPSDQLKFCNTHYGKMVYEKTPTIILLKMQGEDEEGKKGLKVLREFEEKHGGQGVQFAWSEFELPVPGEPHVPDPHEKLLVIIGISMEELPKLVAVSSTMDRLDLTSEIDSIKPDQLMEYMNDMKAGNYRKYMMYQEPVDNTGKDLSTLVGTNYNEIVGDKEKDVFVMIFSNTCGFCRKLVPEWKKMAKEYANRSDVIIAKMDGDKNQVEGLQVRSYPQLILYKKNYSMFPEFYSGDQEFVKIKDWFELMSAGQEESQDKNEEKEDL